MVKLRPVVPNDLPDELRRLESFGIEVDATPGGLVCSASFKGVADPGKTKLASLGKAPMRKVFNKDQRAFCKAHAPQGLELDELSVLQRAPLPGRAGIERHGEQQIKTKKALEFFAKGLKAVNAG